MIDGLGAINAYNVILGAGGEAAFEVASDEIDKNVKETEERIEKDSKKTSADLDPLEQMLLCIDSSLNNFQKIQDGKKLNFFRDQQFRQYVKDAYGVNI